jgi:hypothetical protein
MHNAACPSKNDLIRPVSMYSHNSVYHEKFHGLFRKLPKKNINKTEETLHIHGLSETVSSAVMVLQFS